MAKKKNHTNRNQVLNYTHTTYHIPHTTYHIPHTTYHIPHTISNQTTNSYLSLIDSYTYYPPIRLACLRDQCVCSNGPMDQTVYTCSLLFIYLAASIALCNT